MEDFLDIFSVQIGNDLRKSSSVPPTKVLVGHLVWRLNDFYYVNLRQVEMPTNLECKDAAES